ncbi:MAG: hypothetical protein RL441_1572 [Actinomycetota bacterium]|jgi:HAD superfamily hydrolase (TIGR01450 family)
MLWDTYDSVILDLDGVVYIGEHAVPHAIESLNQIAETARITAATNNASRPADVVGKHLRDLGLKIEDEDVVTSAQAGAALMSSLVPQSARVLAVGGVGVDTALRQYGLHPIRATHDHESNHLLADEVAGVMQGHGTDTSWWDLSTAAWAIARGKHWIATNRDLTVPTPYGLGPGNGSLVAALEAVTGACPKVAGKPQATLFEQTAKRIGAQRPLVIGDRLDTDIDGAIAAGIDSLLVFTGVHQLKDVLDRPAHLRPTFVADDLRCLIAESRPQLSLEIG